MSATAYATELMWLFDTSHPDDAPSTADGAYRAWISRIRNGDAAAFDELMLALARQLIAYARRFVGSLAEAEDVVQDVFAHLWEGRDRLIVRGSVRAYLYTAVRHRAHQRRRGDAREVARWDAVLHEGAVPGMAAPTENAQHDLERAELAARLVAALETLPPRARETALLRWSDGMSRAEIGAIMGVSVATVNNQLTLAARVVRDLLSDLRGSA